MSSKVGVHSADAIDAEIEALKVRIRRLRLERKSAALAEVEAKLNKLAKARPVSKGSTK